MNMQSQKGNTTFYTCTLFNLNSFSSSFLFLFLFLFFIFYEMQNTIYKKFSKFYFWDAKQIRCWKGYIRIGKINKQKWNEKTDPQICALIVMNFYLHFKKRFLNTLLNTYIHTNIIGHYNPSVKIIDLVSTTTYVVCVYFIHKWRDLQFKVDSEKVDLRNFSWQFYLLSDFCQVFFVFCFDVWPEARTLAFVQ